MSAPSSAPRWSPTFLRHHPNQKKVVASMLAGETPDARLGLQAKQRSLHNNYMTLPVLLIMISNHYPMLYGSSINWLVLAALSVSGIMIRHVFNLRHKGELNWLLAFGAVLVFVATMFIAISVQHGADKAPAASVPYAPRAPSSTSIASCATPLIRRMTA